MCKPCDTLMYGSDGNQQLGEENEVNDVRSTSFDARYAGVVFSGTMD